MVNQVNYKLVVMRLGLLFFILSVPGFSQGPLAPPGTPAPTMKTLDQVEPRYPVYTPTTITERGSYYLANNLIVTSSISEVIRIETNDVVLDLNGFTIDAPLSDNAISSVVGTESITVKNGTLRNLNDMACSLNNTRRARCIDLNIFDSLNGIDVGPDSEVSLCYVTRCSEGGITIRANSVARKCTVSDTPDNGILAFMGTKVAHCTIQGCGGGISARSNCEITGNLCISNNVGLFASGTKITLIDNILIGGALDGIRLVGSDNLLSGNQVRGFLDNYDLDPGNQLNLQLSEIPEIIEWPASIHLAGTLTGIAGSNGITIASDNVTVDLGGHTLVGVPGSRDGIEAVSTFKNITIQNGYVRDWGLDGIDLQGSDNKINNVCSINNFSDGIRAGSGAVVKSCIAATNGSLGMIVSEGSTLAECVVRNNSSGGIACGADSTVSGCTAKDNGSTGISGNGGSSIQNCTAENNQGNGFTGSLGTLFEDCVARNNSGSGFFALSNPAGLILRHCSSYDNNGFAGIYAGSDSLVIGCNATRNATNGIFILDESSVIDSFAEFNDIGITAQNDCLVRGNSVIDNDNFGIVVSNRCSVIENYAVNNGTSSGDAGIIAGGSDNKVDGNSAIDNVTLNIRVSSGGNLVVRNTADGGIFYFCRKQQCSGYHPGFWVYQYRPVGEPVLLGTADECRYTQIMSLQSQILCVHRCSSVSIRGSFRHPCIEYSCSGAIDSSWCTHTDDEDPGSS